MSHPQPAIILINPQMGENIGGTARAMLNCGLEQLKLVNPRDGWPSERAETMSAGALQIMPPVEVFKTTAEACQKYHQIYATTARPRDMVKPVCTPEQASVDIKARIESGQNCAILFGCERTGLENEDVALAHQIISVPLNPEFMSLNLSQAVLLMAYEWSKHAQHLEEIADSTEAADFEELDNLYNRLEQSLVDQCFFKEANRQASMMRSIRNMISRSEPTSQEVRTYHGIITALLLKEIPTDNR
jgi:tRNA/rRNA methyltransferase